MRTTSILIVFLLFCVSLKSQIGVIQPNSETSDGYYNRLKYRKPNLFETFYQVPYLQDTNWRIQLYEKQTMWASAYRQVKLPSFNDCVMINDPKINVQYGKNDFTSLFTFRRDLDTFLITGPSLLSYYTSSASMDSLMSMTLTSQIPVEAYLEPFYFRKSEVTNKEYREFVVWVRDSLIRTMLGESGIKDFSIPRKDGLDPPLINWKTPIPWDDPEAKEILEDIYLPESQRYYRSREFDARKFIYDYRDSVDGKSFRTKINIYPDTLCWIRDLDQPEAEKLHHLYFWHKAFDDYPVVGISWSQAKAYLHWKELKLNKELRAQYPRLKIQLELPTVMEWELAQTYLKEDFPVGNDPWLCDLILGPENRYIDSILIDKDTTFTKIETTYINYPYGVVLDGYYEKAPVNMFYKVMYEDTVLMMNGEEYDRRITEFFVKTEKTRFNTIFPSVINEEKVRYQFPYIIAPADLSQLSKNLKLGANKKDIFPKEFIICTDKIKNHFLDQQISFLSGNVSEWMENDDAGWRTGFEKRMDQLAHATSGEHQLQYRKEKHGDEENFQGGRLIKGSNWLHNAVKQVNAGSHVQKFGDPNKGYCTVGFRYVIHLKFVK